MSQKLILVQSIRVKIPLSIIINYHGNDVVESLNPSDALSFYTKTEPRLRKKKN